MDHSHLTKRASTLTLSVVLACSVGISVNAQAEGESDGNRYFLERYYEGEISAAKAYLDAVLKKSKRSYDKDDDDDDGWWSRYYKKKKSKKLIILDVRDATEYKTGHPEGAYHFPYPRIYRECVNDARPEDGGGCTDGTVPESTVLQDPEDLFLMVEHKFPNKSQRFATLCRTGFRSVLAANILSKPEVVICDLNYSSDLDAYANCQAEYDGRGYDYVSNIWQGFVGQPLSGIVSQDGVRYVVGDNQTLADVTLADGTPAKGFVAYDLDLNNDDTISAEDKDGWRYHQDLPYVEGLRRKLRNYEVYLDGYYDLP